MMGPNNTSLLHKLSLKHAYEMSSFELEELVRIDQLRRTTQRAIGRVTRQMKDHPIKPKQLKLDKLEQLGLAPLMIEKLRSSGMSDSKLIQQMQLKGLL